MQTFHNDTKIKKQLLIQLQAHYKADEIIKGKYWNDGKGCAVGCTVHSANHKEFETLIKRFMNDPSSYEHVRTNYVRDKDNKHIIVTTRFRGNNAYGGKVLQSLSAKYTVDGEFVEVVK